MDGLPSSIQDDASTHMIAVTVGDEQLPHIFGGLLQSGQAGDEEIGVIRLSCVDQGQPTVADQRVAIVVGIPR